MGDREDVSQNAPQSEDSVVEDDKRFASYSPAVPDSTQDSVSAFEPLKDGTEEGILPAESTESDVFYESEAAGTEFQAHGTNLRDSLMDREEVATSAEPQAEASTASPADSEPCPS